MPGMGGEGRFLPLGSPLAAPTVTVEEDRAASSSASWDARGPLPTCFVPVEHSHKLPLMEKDYL